MSLNKHVENVATFMEKAGQSVPDKITYPSKEDRILRAKLIMEEALELICDGLGVEISINEYIIDNPKKLSYKTYKEANIVDAMDGAADLLWVGVTGVSVIFGCQLEPIVAEVDRSNLSKFIDGYRDEHGKWIKGPSYSPADIEKSLKDRIS